MNLNLDADKLQAIKQWNSDPCGIACARSISIGTREFYDTIDYNRYRQYAPWMKETIVFDSFPGKKVLEVGFGMGTDLFQFASAGSIVTGIDLVPKHMEIARQRFDLYGIPADLMLGDAENLPFADEVFDVVYSFGVLHHTPNTQKAIAEIYRVLKPGGRVIIALYHKYSAFYIFSHIFNLSFWIEPRRRWMSRIEYRENSDACPLVKVYSQTKVRNMLHKFNSIHIDRRHLELTHFGKLRKFIPSRLIEKLEHKLGWYLIAKCSK